MDAFEWKHSTLTDKPVMAAVRQYQTNFKTDLDNLTMRSKDYGGLRRASIADGEAGTNTHDLMGHARCGCPDYYHPASIDKSGLHRSVEEGNWPDQCRSEVTVSRNFDKLRGLSKDETDSVFTDSSHEWSTRLVMDMVIDNESYPNTMIYVKLANLSGSVLADQYLAISDCGYRSQGRMDIRTWNFKLAKSVRIHEDGHAHGLKHVMDGISTMNPTITQACIEREGRLLDGDLQEAVRIGYTIRKDQSPPEYIWVKGLYTVKSEDGSILGRFEVKQTSLLVAYDGKMWIDGICIIENTGDLQKFILVPKTEL